MGLSIFFSGNQLYVNSGFLEVFLRLAALHIEDPPSPLAREIRDDWLFISSGGHGEILAPGFGDYCSIPEGKAIVLGAFGAVLASLDGAPPVLDHMHLNLLGLGHKFFGSMETERIKALGDDLVSLLNGRAPLIYQ